MHWRDFVDDRRNGEWLGLMLSTASIEGPARPPLRVEACGRRMMRLVGPDGPLLWARVTPDHYGYWYVKSHERRGSLGLVPPIRFDAARAFHPSSGERDWYRSWARHFATELNRSRGCPIGRGDMLLARGTAFHDDGDWPQRGRVSVPPVSHVRQVPAMPKHGFAPWDRNDDLPPLPLRDMSAASCDRVKALRKLVRDDSAPRVLLMWMSGLLRYVVLDGHDRLLASSLEGVLPRCLVLVGLAERLR